MNNIDIKTINNYVIFFNLIFVICISVLIINMKLNYEKILILENERFQMTQLSDKLRQSSDDLTHFARTYVVNADVKFKKQYLDTLAIRNGIKNRPENYNTIYWDLEDPIRAIQHPDGNKISLKDLMSRLPYSREELDLLKVAEKSSNDLVKLEKEAFKLMPDSYLDINQKHTMKKQGNQPLAIKILHSKEYYHAKHKVMSPIDDFMILLKYRTKSELEDFKEISDYEYMFLYFLLSLFIVLNSFFFLRLKRINKNLNMYLENSIADTIEENRKKDKLLFSQSKHAAMGEMIGSIAHQWRQPLNAIAGHIQLIEYDFEDKLIDEKYIETFVFENMNLVNFMSKTIDDFRDFFRVDKTKKYFNAKVAVDATINLISAQLKESFVEVELHVDKKCRVYGFESEFQQVILNIVNNARDALFEQKRNDGKIIITVYEELTFTVFKIQDNAGGIPADIINRIFEPYFTTKEQGKGTGLGLYMSKMIIEENMHGHLSVSHINNGSEFTIAFVNVENNEKAK